MDYVGSDSDVIDQEEYFTYYLNTVDYELIIDP